jgi:pimeloyl-ACP methyl ester carboxylesterase
MREAKSIELEKGRSLHCVTDGSGPDVVLLHGALATSHDWISGPFEKLQEVEGVGHMLHHVRPELVVSALREALAEAG